MCAVCLLPHDSILSASTAVQLRVSASRKQGAGREGERCVLHVSSGAQIAKMASTKGSASAGIRKAATETWPSTWEWMCCNMRGQSAMPHPQRIAVKLGRASARQLSLWLIRLAQQRATSNSSPARRVFVPGVPALPRHHLSVHPRHAAVRSFVYTTCHVFGLNRGPR